MLNDTLHLNHPQATTTQATIAATANMEVQEQRAKADLQAAAVTYCTALQRLLQVRLLLVSLLPDR